MKSKFDELIDIEARERWTKRFGKATIADDFKAGAEFVAKNPLMIESVAKLVEAAKLCLDYCYSIESDALEITQGKHEDCSSYGHTLICSLSRGHDEDVERLELALKNLEAKL